VRPERCPARIHPATGLLPAIVSALLFATCEADDDGDLNAVVTVGPAALLLLWRGYADQARRTRPAPRFHAARRLLAETLSPLPLAISREARVRWRTPARTRTQSRWGRRRLSAPPRLRPAHNLARPWPGALDGRSAMRLHKPGRVVALSMWTDGRSVRATFGAPVHRRPSTSARSYVHGIDALASGAAEGVGEGRRPAPVQIGDGRRRGPFSGL